MITFIKGAIASLSPSAVVLDVNGIGYNILITPQAYAELPGIGTAVTLFTSFIVREQSQTLYGFLLPETRDMFELLITMSGIGPKTALAILGHLGNEGLQQAVHNCDIPMISAVPGIGKKTAERLIIDMRDKLSAPKRLGAAFSGGGAGNSSTICDAMSALINLGYNQKAAESALKKALKSSIDVNDLSAVLTEALKCV